MKAIFSMVITIAIIVFTISCNKDCPDGFNGPYCKNYDIAGKWSVHGCGAYDYTSSITGNSSGEIEIHNLAGLYSLDVSASVKGNVLTIPYQKVVDVSGIPWYQDLTYLVSGGGTISEDHNTISVSFNVTGSANIYCSNSTWTRQ